MKFIMPFTLGILFGLALFMAGAANRRKILDMLQFKNLTLMKIILLAVGTAIVLIQSAYRYGFLDISHFGIKTMHLGVVLGAAILAVGFALTGLCPGTAVASLGAGYWKALYLILGGLAGAGLFTLAFPYLNEMGFFTPLLQGKSTIFFINEKFPYIFQGTYRARIFLGVFMIFIALVLPERFDKWK